MRQERTPPVSRQPVSDTVPLSTTQPQDNSMRQERTPSVTHQPVSDNASLSTTQSQDDSMRQERTPPVSHQTLPDSAHLPKFKIMQTDHFPTAYGVVTAMEKEQPELKLSITVNLKGEIIITPQDQQTASYLEKVRVLQGKPVCLEKLDPSERRTRVVLLGYPIDFPLDPVLEHKQILNAERCCT